VGAEEGPAGEGRQEQRIRDQVGVLWEQRGPGLDRPSNRGYAESAGLSGASSRAFVAVGEESPGLDRPSNRGHAGESTRPGPELEPAVEGTWGRMRG